MFEVLHFSAVTFLFPLWFEFLMTHIQSFLVRCFILIFLFEAIESPSHLQQISLGF